MRLLVCGGRNYHDARRVSKEIQNLAPSVVIEGGADGADWHARMSARALGIPVITYNPDWSKNGKSAGPMRNQRMLDEGRPDVVLAFPGGAGTADMVRRAMNAGIKVIGIVS